MIDLAAYGGDASTMNETARDVERIGRWPDLKAAQDFDCDGENPTTGSPCLLGHHQGYHRDQTGAVWLDD